MCTAGFLLMRQIDVFFYKKLREVNTVKFALADRIEH